MPNSFEIAHCFVALGGDIQNTVPKSNVTAAEIAVLQVIHGNDAVRDIEPVGSIQRSQREERERLRAVYGRARDSEGRSLVEVLYPGAAARTFEKLDELQLEDVQFKIARGARPTTPDIDMTAKVAAAPTPSPAEDEEWDELPADDEAEAAGALS